MNELKDYPPSVNCPLCSGTGTHADGVCPMCGGNCSITQKEYDEHDAHMSPKYILSYTDEDGTEVEVEHTTLASAITAAKEEEATELHSFIRVTNDQGHIVYDPNNNYNKELS